MGFRETARRILGAITIEPLIFGFMTAQMLEAGSEVNANLLIKKVCLYELGQNQTSCDNLDLDENEELETEGKARRMHPCRHPCIREHSGLQFRERSMTSSLASSG